MDFGISLLSLVPVRKEPSDKSELTNQLLFGDLYYVKEKHLKWIKIETVFDNYEGWIDIKQWIYIDEDSFIKLKKENYPVTFDYSGILNDITDNFSIPILLGSTIPTKNIDNKFVLFDKEFNYNGKISLPIKDNLIQNAYLYLNSPYLWGGRSPFGIDCSGFTQMVFKLSGIKLQRDASQQAKQGNIIDFLVESKPGDLAFFESTKQEIIHVGILLGNNKIIHSSGRVRIDSIDHNGIFNNEIKKYSHKLRIVKRII